jgi:membrane protein YqaA with SNARE-associated domain
VFGFAAPGQPQGLPAMIPMLIIFHALSALSLWLKDTLLPYGGPGLMVLAICDSSFISLSGINDVLLITFAVARPGSMVELAGFTALGSVIGCVVLYALGRKGGETFLKKRFADDRLARIQAWYRKFGVLAVIVPAVLPPPTPLKLFVLSAGAFEISWPKFLTGIAIGRSIRYFALGILAITYGPAAIDFAKMNFGKIGVATAALIVMGTLVYLLARRRTRSIEV